MQPFDLIFILFATSTLFTASMVVFSRQAVHSALFLIFTFVNVSALWMTLQSEFLSLALIFVYVGAVMTLLLFVVMMFNIDPNDRINTSNIMYNFFNISIGILVTSLFIVLILQFETPISFTADKNSALSLGRVLYSDYVIPFIVVSMILLIGMVGAVSVTFKGKRSDRKSQNISKQIFTNKMNRIKMVSGKLNTDKNQ